MTSAPEPLILAIDDDPTQIDVLAQLLAGTARVVGCTDPVEALSRMSVLWPDLVLLDLQMPVLDGFGVLAALGGDHSFADIPVIVVTADGSVEVESRCLEAGAVDYVIKPINPRVLRARVATQLTLRRQTEQLRTLVFRDTLTGASSRRAFDERLPGEWSRAARTGQPLSLAMLDVDHFKRYNDAHSHLAGDDALRAIVGAVSEVLQRPTDMVARYGGEEFVVMLPNTPISATVDLLKRVDSAVRALALPHSDSPTADVVTLSMGAASTEQGFGHSHRALLARADRQLYRAKAEGRSRLCAEDHDLFPWGE